MAGRIVVGVDGSEEAGAALRWALEEAELRDAVVEAVHAWTYIPPVTPADSGLVPMAWTDTTGAFDATREAAERIAQDQVRKVAGDARRVEVTVVQGDPANALLERAEDADLLVVGNRGRGNLAQVLFGSISARVSDKAHCPVVVVTGHDTA